MAWSRSTIILGGAVSMGVMLRWGGPLVAGDSRVLLVIVSLFGILTGFVIAVITSSSDPKFLRPGNWRVASVHRREIQRALWRYQALFYVYLTTVLLAFATALARNTEAAAVSHWLERCTLSLATGAFVWSFGLPAVIAGVRRSLLANEVEKRRKLPGQTATSADG